MSSNFVQEIVLRIRADGTAEVQKLTDSIRQVGQGASGAKGGVSELGNEFEKTAGSIVKTVLELAGFGVMLRTLKEAVTFADDLRDIQNSLQLLSSSVESGKAVFEKFEAVAKTTRYSTEELARSFRDSLPSAIRRGVSDETLSNIVIQMAKIAPMLKGGLEAGMADMEGIFAGRIRRTSEMANLLLRDTGYKIEDLMAGGKDPQVIEAMLRNLDKLANGAGNVGQSFASVGRQIKETFFDAFARGFNQANGDTQNLYERMLKNFNDPKLVQGFEAMGQAAQKLLTILESVVKALGKITVEWPSKLGEWIGFMGNPAAPTLPGASQPMWTPSAPAQPTQRSTWLANNRNLTNIQGTLILDETLPKVTMASGGPPVKPLGTDTAAQAAKAATEAYEALIKAAGRAKDAEEVALAAFEARMKVGGEIASQFAKIDTETAIKTKQMWQEAEEYAAKPTTTVERAQAATVEWGKAVELVRANAERMKQEFADKVWQRTIEEAAAAALRMDKAVQSIRESLRSAVTETNRMIAAFAAGNGGANAMNPFVQQAQAQQEEYAKQARELEFQLAMARAAGQEKEIERLGLAAKKLEEAIKRGAEALLDAAGKLETLLVEPLADAFYAILTDGAKGFGQLAAQWLGQSLRDRSHEFAEFFAKVIAPAFGAKPEKMEGESPEAFQKRVDLGEKQNKALVSGIQGAVGGIVNAINNQASDLSTAVTSAVAALPLLSIPVYGWIAYAAVQVATAAIKIFSPGVGKDYPYASFGIDPVTGQPRVTGNRNVDVNAARELRAAWKSTADEFYAGYGNILIKLGAAIPGGLTRYPTPRVGRFEEGADIGMAASQGFWQEIDRWLRVGLPRQMGQQFKGPIEQAFTSMGMTTERFNKIWGELDLMDPKEALQVLNDLADALVGWNKVLTASRNLRTWNIEGGLISPTGEQGQNEFMQFVSGASEHLYELGEAVKSMPLKQGAAAAKELAAGVGDLQSGLIAFLNRVRQTHQALSQMISDSRFNAMVQYGGGPNAVEGSAAEKNRLTALYEKRYQEDLYKIRNAVSLGLSPEQVAQYTNDANQMLNNILALDPAKRLDWFFRQLDVLEDAQTAALKALGEEARTAVEAVIHDLEPIVAKFLDIGTATEEFDKTITNATASVVEFGKELDRISGREGGGGGGSEGGGAEGGGGGNGGSSRGTEGERTITVDSGDLTGAMAAVLAELRQLANQVTQIEIIIGDPKSYVKSVRSHRVAKR